MWKEFCAQAISKVICAVKGMLNAENLLKELEGYLRDVIKECLGEGLI